MLQEHDLKVRHQNMKSPSSKTQKSVTPIDDSIDDSINNKENEINFVKEETNLILEEETDMYNSLKEEIEDIFKDYNKPDSVEPKRKSAPADESKVVKKDYIETLLDIFKEEYLLSRKKVFLGVKGKDLAGIGKILLNLKTIEPKLTSDNMSIYFRKFCQDVLNIKDNFHYTKINPMYIYSNFDQLKLLILNTKEEKVSSSVGQATGNGDYTTTFTNYKKG